MTQRLAKVLARAGVASRRAAETLIFDGKVSVDGTIVKIPQTLVNPETNKICVLGKPIGRQEQKFYFLLNKPKGYLCTNKKSSPKSKIVVELFGNKNERLFTVGRLDKETTGLILVTNDGMFAHKVIHPSSNLTKEYLVRTHEEITPSHLKKILLGMKIDKTWVRPLKVKKRGKNSVKITIGEGKKREIRYLISHVELTLAELSRVRIGPLHLGNLPEGAYRSLKKTEISALLEKN